MKLDYTVKSFNLAKSIPLNVLDGCICVDFNLLKKISSLHFWLYKFIFREGGCGLRVHRLFTDARPLGTFENQDARHDALYLDDLTKK